MHILYTFLAGRGSFESSAYFKAAFQTLRTKLLTSLVPAYPDFNNFTLETDVRYGLGATLSQYKEDQQLHPVAYASRFVSTTEVNYATITDLETLAVVWAVTHF